MQSFTLVLIFTEDFSKVLMLKRTKDPYKNLYNFLGGKIEKGESPLESAQRELEEESGLKNIQLSPLVTMDYPLDHTILHVFLGKTHQTKVIDEIHPLLWMDTQQSMAGEEFAGLGNCEHLLRLALYFKEKI